MIMETLVISPDFTIDDVHKSKECNCYKTKDMTIKEIVTYHNNAGREAEREIEKRRILKQKTRI